MSSVIPNLYTINEVASILRVTRRTVCNLLSKGKIRHAKIGNRVRISEPDFMDYLERNRTDRAVAA